MGAPRKLAAALLRLTLRLSPRTSRDWAGAMLRELDFVPGEWAALFWALGGAVAIVRHAGAGCGRFLARFIFQWEEGMNSRGKKTIGVASGALSALALAGCAFALLRLVDIVFPALNIARTEWTHWLTAILIPEAIFIAAAIVLWRKKGPVAAGILLVAVAIGLHFVVHIATH